MPLAKKVPWTRIMSAIADLASLEGYAERMRLPAEAAMEVMMHHLEAQQPLGHDEVQQGGTGKVSDRLGHTPIEKGWREEAELLGKGVHIKITNISEHFAPVVEGAIDHDIDGTRGSLVFWWGDPHPWPAPEVSYTGLPMGPGLYAFPGVDHPGQPPNPFVRNAKDLAEPGMTDRIRSGTEHYIWDTLAAAGLRRVR